MRKPFKGIRAEKMNPKKGRAETRSLFGYGMNKMRSGDFFAGKYGEQNYRTVYYKMIYTRRNKSVSLCFRHQYDNSN